jgi:hypothetical protein
MDAKYIIEEKTLANIADSIRFMEKSSSSISVEDYANRIKHIEPTIEEYMYLLEYSYGFPNYINDVTITKEEIDECYYYLSIFETEGTING